MKGKKLYCCFVDYRKAFDSVNRGMLFYKLSQCGIDCKIMNIIRSMYVNVKSCVKYKSQLSEYFSCSQGLMQGESLSPILFSLYVNDFEMEFIKTCVFQLKFEISLSFL